MMGLALVALAVLLEAVGQLALKQGAERAHAETSKWGWVRGLWRNRAVALGILCFIAHGVLWTMAIRLLDISIAFPASSIGFVFVALLSKTWLHEQVGLERWIGLGFILGGVVLVGSS
ncbi:hypothetical protein LBMAG45_16490 [Nitrospirota bacterium]|jgi:undecaprenyl phosphate-alpha-L-ara4N flippase subunit ArnE|nr:hypothetical protein LBMAG45_16490 [Nitrospirota bacterium]